MVHYTRYESELWSSDAIAATKINVDKAEPSAKRYGGASSPQACQSQAAGKRGNNSVYREFRFDNEMTQL
ncbi:hypothetical protein EVAR_88801_1 [Eumeta japonica]|uniref:Uncharacterized protein n=1 Tax=Eumeta variegata TaxID=151549 RepID=A0A4C1YLH5_EUMVA|nr:hypothetical protein EVAR_88801_1 [Eumeta japonica]